MTEKSTISNWRSETLKAFSATPEVQHQAASRAEEVAVGMFDKIIDFLPSLAGCQESLSKLYCDIVLPAKSLAADTQAAPSRYTFNMHGLHPGYRAVGADCLGSSKIAMIDAKTRKPLKSDSLIVPDRNGHIAQPLIQLEPGILRISSDTDAQVRLRKAVFVVDLLNP